MDEERTAACILLYRVHRMYTGTPLIASPRSARARFPVNPVYGERAFYDEDIRAGALKWD